MFLIDNDTRPPVSDQFNVGRPLERPAAILLTRQLRGHPRTQRLHVHLRQPPARRHAAAAGRHQLQQHPDLERREEELVRRALSDRGASVRQPLGLPRRTTRSARPRRLAATCSASTTRPSRRIPGTRRRPTSAIGSSAPASSAFRATSSLSTFITLASGLGFTIDDNSRGSGDQPASDPALRGPAAGHVQLQERRLPDREDLPVPAAAAGVDRVRRASTSSTRRTSSCYDGFIPAAALDQPELRPAELHGRRQQPAVAVRPSLLVLGDAPRPRRADRRPAPAGGGRRGRLPAAGPRPRPGATDALTGRTRRSSRICRGARSCSSGSRPIPGPASSATGPGPTAGRPTSRRGNRQHRVGRIRALRACASPPSAAGCRATQVLDRDADDAAVLRRTDAAGARLVLSLRQPADRRARVAERAVVDRHRAAARRGADGAPLLRRRSRDRPPRRRASTGASTSSWMLAGDPGVLSHGWKPESGFLTGRWDHYCELMILYLLGIGSPTHAIPPASWRAWSRPTMTFERFAYVSAADPLFVHQYSHAWVDFRGRRECDATGHRLVRELRHRDPRAQGLLSEPVAGVSRLHATTCGGSRRPTAGRATSRGAVRRVTRTIDGSVVPAAAGGSLMFAPDITVPALREMQRRFGDRIYGRYGFADAFHPTERLGESGRDRHRSRASRC